MRRLITSRQRSIKTHAVQRAAMGAQPCATGLVRGIIAQPRPKIAGSGPYVVTRLVRCNGQRSGPGANSQIARR
jgi:hypothetical protein